MSSDENKATGGWGGAEHREVNLKTGRLQRDPGAQSTPSLLAAMPHPPYAPSTDSRYAGTAEVSQITARNPSFAVRNTEVLLIHFADKWMQYRVV